MNGSNGACLFLLLLILLLLLLSVLRMCEWECLIREIYCLSLFSYMLLLARTMKDFFFFLRYQLHEVFSSESTFSVCFFISDKAQCECAVYCCFCVAQKDGEIKTR